MTDFGLDDARRMPRHLFMGLRHMDYSSAVRADTSKQNCSICPRYWYVDAAFACARCGDEFWFTAAEQRTWYEDYGFWIDSLPKHCLTCRRVLRDVKALRQDYDRDIAAVVESGDVTSRERLAGIIDRLCELSDGRLPAAMHEHRRRLAALIAKARTSERPPDTPPAAAR